MVNSRFEETLPVCGEEPGVPLNEYLAKNQGEEPGVHCDFRPLIYRMWQNGFFDLDIAFHHYLMRVDNEGQPVERDGG